MRRRQIMSLLLSAILAMSTLATPFAQLPVYAAEAANDASGETEETGDTEALSDNEVSAANDNSGNAARNESANDRSEAAGKEEVVIDADDKHADGNAVNEAAVAREAEDESSSAGEVDAESSAGETDAGASAGETNSEALAGETNADTAAGVIDSEASAGATDAEAAVAGATSAEGTDTFIFTGVVSVTTEGQEALPEDRGGETPDDLFADYVDKSFNGESIQAPSPKKKAARKTTSNLSEIELAIYNNISVCLPQIAAGERASTVFEIAVDELGLEKTAWTAGELGVASILTLDENGNVALDGDGNASISTEAIEAARAKTAYDLNKIINSLLADNPYQLYWYEKTQNTVATGFSFSASYDNTVGDYVIGPTGSATISFPVAGEFSAGEYTVDTSIGQAVQTSVANANAIVSKYSSATDYEKLTGYKDDICELVSYNNEAAGGDVDYGNPWQMIWVFDQDPTTSVVCEGYAKAFKYLCDQSNFNGDISCITVTGTMSGGTGEGPHMWNVVNMEDGKNYLVDVTNCDEGTIGEPDQLFLTGTPDKILSGERETGYIIHALGGDITYQYDADTLELYSQDDLSLSDTSYVVNYGNESVYMPSTGDVKVLYVMVNFADVALSESEKDGFGGAVVYNTQFYESSSYGKLRLNADTRECTVARTRSFYEDPHQDGSNDISYGRELFLKDVLHELDSTTDFSEYDSNNDGYIDGLFIRFAGNGSGWGSLWSSYTAQEHEGFTVDGVKTSWYVYLDSHSLTTLVHETGHLLGLPDYYDNRWGSTLSDNIAESQDIMFDGSGDHNAYSKYVLGWIDHPYIVDTLDSTNDIQLRPSMNYPDAAIIYPNGDRSSEQFFVVEYVTSSNGLSIKSNNYGGLRIWRVDSAKLEQRNDQIPLIQSVQCGGNTYISNHGWQTMLDNGQHYYSSIFYTGDELTPYTNPSSYIYADPNGSMDNLAFSGVSVTSINTEGETASCSVTIDSEPSENALEYTLQYSADSALIFKLSFNHDISVRNEGNITITSNGQTLDETKVAVVNNTELNVSCNRNIVAGNQYTLTIPAGTIVTTYGKENEEIVFTATAYGFRNVSTVDKQAGGQHLVSPVYEFSDGSLSFFKLNNNALCLCTYENDEIHESVILEADSLSHLAATQMNAGQYVLRFFKDERGVTYLYDVNDGLRLIKVHDPEEPLSSGAFPVGDDKIIYNIYQNYYSLTFDGEVQPLNTDINTMEGVVYPIKDGRFVYADGITNHLMLLDSEFNVLKEIPNTGIMESREHIDEVMEDGDYIYVFSVINKAFYMTIYDADFSFIRKTQILSQDGIKERIGHVYKTEDGFIITGSVKYEQISHGGASWNVSGGRIWICDESFELVTSYTDLVSGKSTDFDNVIVTDNGTIIASNWQKIARLDNLVPVVEETEKAPVPNITKQPQDVCGKEGEFVTLSVEAEGEGLSYNWQVNNEEGVWESVDGTTDHITVELTATPQTYRCLVKNKAYNILSSRVVQCKGGDYEHTSIKFEAKAATCTEEGNIEYYECIDCHKIFSDEGCTIEITAEDTVTPATGHVWSEWVVVKEATEDEEGLERRTCINDADHTEERMIPKLKHVHNLTKTEAKAASCTEAGNTEYWTCSKCGKNYSDADGENEISLEATVIHALGHTWSTEYTVDKEATHTEEGSESIHCTVCGESDPTTVRAIPKTVITLLESDVPEMAAMTYTGKELTQSFEVVHDGNTLTEGVNYTVKYDDNVNAGTATVMVTGIGAYTGEIVRTFKIAPKKVTPVVTLTKTAFVYSGKVIKPGVTVKVGGVKLATKYYTVSYQSGRKNVGKYKVVVKLRGNYIGNKAVYFVYFTINPKGTAISSLVSGSKKMTVKWKKQAVQTSGYLIQVATNKGFTTNKKTVLVSGASKVSKVITGLKGGKKYYVRIRTYKTVGGVKFYSGWSAVKAVTVKK